MSGKMTTKKKGSSPSAVGGKPSSISLKPEERMNLTSLKRHDPYIEGILDTASQVALYLFNEPDDAWEKTDVEGTLFVYERSAAPYYGLTISNRKVIVHCIASQGKKNVISIKGFPFTYVDAFCYF